MEDFLKNIGAFILLIVVLLGIFLILPLMSKLSGRGIRRRGSRTTMIRPTDFDDTIDMLKVSGSNIKNQLTNAVGKIGLDSYNKIIFDIDKTISKTASLTFTEYILIAAKVQELEEKIKGSFHPDFEYRDMLAVHQRLHSFLQDLDLDKVIEFFKTHLDLSKEAHIVILFDCIHLENLRPLDKIMAVIQKGYWTNALEEQQVNKLKNYLLQECFQLPESCFTLEWRLSHAWPDAWPEL